MATYAGSGYCTPTNMATQGFVFDDPTKQWTISAMFKGTGDGQRIGITLDSGRINWYQQDIPNGEWKRISWTFYGSSTLITFRFENAGNITTEKPIYVALIKCESGNKMTDWSPAPEDLVTNNELVIVQERIENAETSIIQNSNSILLKASKEEVNTAKSEAISIAASDASTKTNTALNDAKDYAKKYSDSQYNNLEIGGRNLIIQHTFANINERLAQTTNTTEYTYADYGYVTTDKIYVNPGETFILSAQKEITGYLALGYFDSNDIYTNRKIMYLEFNQTTKDIITIPEGVAYCRISFMDSDKNFIKFEKGNKVTDWSPAPEDVNNDINILETRITTAETNITQNSEAINLRATKTEVNTAKTEAINTASSDATTKANSALNSAKSYADSQIQVSANSITSSVSNTYVTKSTFNTNIENVQNTADSANTKIDSLNIGGRNLIQNSNFENGKTITLESGTGSSASIVADDVYGQFLRLDIQAFGSNDRFYINTSNVWRQNQSYAVSFMAKASVAGITLRPSRSVADYGDEVTLTTSWKRYTGIIVSTTTTPGGTLSFSYGGKTGVIDITNIKLEKGNRSSDWTPAPEDMATSKSVTDLTSRVASTESNITQLSNKITSNITETTNLGARMSTVEQTADGLTTSLSTTNTNVTNAQSTANTARTEASNAAKTATNYLSFSSSGLVIGDMTASTLGENVLIDSNSVDIRNGTTVNASFGANTIYLGKNSEKSVISLCNGSASMTCIDDSDFRIYTDKRLVMKAYSSMLLDCWRDSTHMTRIAIQSADPEETYMWGGVGITIYQDTVKTTFDLYNNTAELKIIKGTTETRMAMDENVFKVYANNQVRLNSKSSVLIAESSTYKAGITLGYSYGVAKAINCYWCDGAVHDLVSNSSNGQASYFGPGDIDESTTTYIRGQYVRIYNHSGGGVYLGASGSTAVTSDRNMKKDIFDIDDKYLEFFDKLKPITYKYNEGHRDHIGFIAQDVEEALTSSGLTTEQFAGIIKEENVTVNSNYDSSLSDEENAANAIHYNELYSLRYEEFISLLVKKVQNLQNRINDLERRII